MPCACALGACASCACAKAGRACTAACHGGAAQAYCLNDEVGRRLSALPAAEVKKLCIASGLSLIGNAAELKTALAQRLRAEAAEAAPAPSSSSSSSAAARADGGAPAAGGLSNAAAVRAVYAVGVAGVGVARGRAGAAGLGAGARGARARGARAGHLGQQVRLRLVE